MRPVRVEPRTPRSPVKHSTTEPLRSHSVAVKIPIKKNLVGSEISVLTRKMCVIAANILVGVLENIMGESFQDYS